MERIPSAARLMPLLVLTATAAALVGCTTQPAMNQSYVAALTTGQLQINVPPHDVVVVPKPGFWQSMGAVLGGAVGGAIAGATSNVQSAQSNPYLKPYAKIISSVPLTQDFRNIGRKVTGTVLWLSSSDPKIAEKPAPLGSGWMQREAQQSPFDAVAFVQPTVVFSMDMKRVTIRAQISVYARGPRHPSFLDGGTVTAGTPLGKSGTPLSDKPIDKLAKSHENGNKNFSARAKLWFANSGYRFKNAIQIDFRLLTHRLQNYFNGHRT